MARPGENPPTGHTSVGRHEAVSTEQRMATFHSRMRERGLKSTAQRDHIARVFFDMGRHVSAEELYAEVKKITPHMGYATIYRTLRLLRECELLQERHFDEGQARYEAVDERHHDHFICERCGKIIEFENDSWSWSRASSRPSCAATRWSCTGSAPTASRATAADGVRVRLGHPH
jgi:Fur family ferric uptake transcriptional regulator